VYFGSTLVGVFSGIICRSEPDTIDRYFKPQSIAVIGACQDGGLWMNDPTSLVDSEIGVIAPEAGEPLVVSVGTGSAKVNRQLETSNGRRFWKNGLVHRLYEALMASMSSKRYWRSGDSYFRFDVDFCGREPELDDVHRIPAMAVRADEQFRRSSRLGELASRFIAEHFHFELQEVPRRMGDQIIGAGYILCDLKYGHPAYEALLDKLSRDGARFYFNGSPISGRINDRSFTDSAGNVRRRVEFTTTRETISICLKTRHSEPQQISRSPFSIGKRLQDQNLDAFFGQANHRKRACSSLDIDGTPLKRRRIHR
jgi:hypothetical protein